MGRVKRRGACWGLIGTQANAMRVVSTRLPASGLPGFSVWLLQASERMTVFRHSLAEQARTRAAVGRDGGDEWRAKAIQSSACVGLGLTELLLSLRACVCVCVPACLHVSCRV